MANQKMLFFFVVFLSNWEFFVWNWEKNILFGIGKGAEFRPKNRVIESPVTIIYFQTRSKVKVKDIQYNDVFEKFFAIVCIYEISKI